MISLLEVAERAQSGPKMSEKTWNLGMFRKMQELTRRYRLVSRTVGKFYEVENEYADRLFAAAVDYLCEMGVFCISTNRAIQFTVDEVQEACREAPNQFTVGTDRDRRTFIQRDLEDTRPPNIITGGHSAWNEALMPLEHMIKELVRIPRVDFLEGFNYHRVMGREVHGTPLIVYAARKAIERARLGVRLAGRAGLALCYYPILTTAAALIAPKDEAWGLRSSDGILLSVLPDLKVESELIAAAIYYDEYGCFRQNGGVGGAVGGFAGGWEGAMIEAIVRNIAAWMVYHDAVQYQGSVDRLRQSPWALNSIGAHRKSDEETLKSTWCSFAVHMALHRHKNTIMNAGAGSGGRVTDQVSVENLLWTAMDAIRGTILGVNIRCVRTPPPTTVRWVVEISDAALKSHLSLMDLDEIVERIQRERLTAFNTNQDPRMLLYSNPHAFFKSHQACYDYVKQRPTERFLANRCEARDYLENIGLKLA
jgi:hypothetical protein